MARVRFSSLALHNICKHHFCRSAIPPKCYKFRKLQGQNNALATRHTRAMRGTNLMPLKYPTFALAYRCRHVHHKSNADSNSSKTNATDHLRYGAANGFGLDSKGRSPGAEFRGTQSPPNYNAAARRLLQRQYMFDLGTANIYAESLLSS